MSSSSLRERVGCAAGPKLVSDYDLHHKSNSRIARPTMIEPTDRPGVRREKRNFSRIDENVFMEFHLMKAKNPAQKSVANPSKGPDRADRLQQLKQINAHIRSLLPLVRTTDVNTARCLAAINKKIDLLANAVSRKREDRAVRFTRRVNLSAGGVGFRASAALDVGARLAIRLAAPDYNLRISAFGDVVYCERDAADAELPYRVGVSFPSLKMSDRQLLFSHVLGRYVERIRAVKAPP